MSIRILLVAGQPAFRERLELALGRLEADDEDVEFLHADNGNDALVVAESRPPDLVVVEAGATPYGGFGLTRDLKASPELACPVILILDRMQDDWLGRWSGADALVHRPVDPFALARMAAMLLEEDRAEPPAGEEPAAAAAGSRSMLGPGS